MTNRPTVPGYSFYLNVVLIHSDAAREDEAVVEPVASSSVEENLEPGQEAAASIEPALDKGEQEETAVVPTGPVIDAKADPKLKLLIEGRSLVDSVFNRPKRSKSSEANKFVQDGQRLMNSIGSSISRSSSNISKRASRFVANKTMMSRAEKAVGESIPLVTQEIGVEMSISKRFQQGPVFVLEVDLKTCDLLDLSTKVLGEERAEHFRRIEQGLETLDLPDTKAAFLSEMVPKVRKGLMDRMSQIVPEKMKLKKQYADLEIQCVALEDAEEAKWIYNFLAFMEEMK